MRTACCGLDCDVCEANLATKANDNALRAATAEKWSKMYNHPMKPEDINCTGCRVQGAKIGHCLVCAVRKCCMERGHRHCGVCDQYPCKTIEDFLGMMPAEMAAANRNRLRNGTRKG
jgi:hypothetical protein